MNEWIIVTSVVISGQLALGMSLFAAAARGDRGVQHELQPEVRAVSTSSSSTLRSVGAAKPTLQGVA